MITSMMVLMMFGSDGDNDNINDGVDDEYDTGVSECVNSTHVQDSFYCPSSVLSGQQIIIIIVIIMLEMVRMVIDNMIDCLFVFRGIFSLDVLFIYHVCLFVRF